MFSSSGRDYTKSFIDTEKALIVYNHNPLASLEGKWTSHEVICTCPKMTMELYFEHQVDLELGQTQHYRKYCIRNVNGGCGQYLARTVKDTSVWRWKDAVIRNSLNVLHKLLGFI